MNPVKDVAEFHRVMEIPALDSPQFPEKERIDLRLKLVEEEWKETKDAIEAKDLVETADGIANMIYVLVGMALEFGIPLEKVWDEVQRSNMSKIDSMTGMVLRRGDGKILKPTSWSPPDIESILDSISAKEDFNQYVRDGAPF